MKVFRYLIDAYKYTISLIVNRIRYAFAKKTGKIEQYRIDISKLPRDEQIRILTEKLLAERQEKAILEQRLKELQDKLDKLRIETFGKVLEKLYKEEKETGKLPVSLYELLRKAKSVGLLPFRKPPVVFDITMQRLGYLEDIVIHPDGGLSFVIKVGRDKFITPPFGSLWEAVYHPENLSAQLPNVIILNLWRDEKGRLLKVPPHLINKLYHGEPVEKIIAELQNTVNKLASELESTKVNAEMISLQNQLERINRRVSETLANTSLNLFEKQIRDMRNILIPTTMASIEASTAMQLDVAQERSKSEHLRDLIDQYSARIKRLEDSLAPERIIAIQNEMIDKLKNISKTLAEIQLILKGAPQIEASKEEKKKE